jgi:hypothetical protein
MIWFRHFSKKSVGVKIASRAIAGVACLVFSYQIVELF